MTSKSTLKTIHYFLAERSGLPLGQFYFASQLILSILCFTFWGIICNKHSQWPLNILHRMLFLKIKVFAHQIYLLVSVCFRWIVSLCWSRSLCIRLFHFWNSSQSSSFLFSTNSFGLFVFLLSNPSSSLSSMFTVERVFGNTSLSSFSLSYSFSTYPLLRPKLKKKK